MEIEKLKLPKQIGWVVVQADNLMTRSDTYPTKNRAIKAAERMIQNGYGKKGIYLMNISSAWLIRKK